MAVGEGSVFGWQELVYFIEEFSIPFPVFMLGFEFIGQGLAEFIQSATSGLSLDGIGHGSFDILGIGKVEADFEVGFVPGGESVREIFCGSIYIVLHDQFGFED